MIAIYDNRYNNKNYHRDYYLHNKDKILKNRKIRYKLNRNGILSSQKKWRKDNKAKIRRMRKLRFRKRIKDLNYRVYHNLRVRLYFALRKNKKKDRTLTLLGCSVNELKTHLSSKFKSGMTWDNYGKWHIDHIKPCCAFDLSKKEDQEACFNYTNLQPLWAEENIIKGGRF